VKHLPNSCRRLVFVVIACCVFIIGTSGAIAQTGNYPDKPIKLLVPYAPGSTTTNLARLLAEKLGQALGGSMYVENKPGAGGNLGMQYIAQSKPDGYSLLMAPIGVSINPVLYKDLPFNPIRDLVPIGLYASVPNLLVINPEVPATNLEEFLDYAKKNPGKLNYASSGSGSSSHLASEMLKAAAHIDMTHVPYKGGGAAMTDLIGGRVQVLFDQTPGVLPFLRDQRVRVIAVSSAKPSSATPEIPPLATAVPGFDMTVWFGIMAPAGTPKPIVDRINAEMVKILQDPSFKLTLTHMGVDAMPSTPAQFGSFLQIEMDRWAKVIKDADIKVD
jgi:tripartite-type tricarboxylate transporter receptor subunit TctC